MGLGAVGIESHSPLPCPCRAAAVALFANLKALPRGGGPDQGSMQGAFKGRGESTGSAKPTPELSIDLSSPDDADLAARGHLMGKSNVAEAVDSPITSSL